MWELSDIIDLFLAAANDLSIGREYLLMFDQCQSGS